MKKTILTIIALGAISPLFAQIQGSADTTTEVEQHAPATSGGSTSDHKSSNSVLPRWAIDAKYNYNWLNQDISLIDLKAAYGGQDYARTFSYNTKPKFQNGSGMSGDLRLSYFFNAERNLGVSIGIQYAQYKGSMSLDSGMYLDFQTSDVINGTKRIYRQIIRNNTDIQEDVTITNINVPVLFEFKHQFGSYKKAAGGAGIWFNLGPVFGFSGSTEGIAKGTLSYEGVYNADGSNTLDASSGPFYSGHSLVLTEYAYDHTHTDGSSATKYLDEQRNGTEKYNVGLGKDISSADRTKTNSYNKVSFGGMLQAGVSYAITYKVHFLLGGHIMYQQWQNNGNEHQELTNTITDAGVNYSGLTAVIKSSNYLSYGVNAGFRIYLGGKRDVDGDGVPDATDNCPYEKGLKTLDGCPDKDGDGVADKYDHCPELPGDKAFDGCPDSDNDGIPDDRDSCKDAFGELANGCPISSKYQVADTVRDLPKDNGDILPPHILLESTTLLFEFGKADLDGTATEALDHAATVLSGQPKVVLYLSGYTDNIGTDKQNRDLSTLRAKAAMDYLIKKGFEEKRLIMGGYGKDRPVVPNDTKENRAKNRRVEMMLLLPL